MRRLRTLLFLSCLPLLGWATACGGQQHTSGADSTVQQRQPEIPKGSATIVLINQSAEPIHRIAIAPHQESDVTDNLLQEGPLIVGQSIALEGFPAGTWDISVQDSSGKSRTFKKQRIDDHKEYSLIIDAYHWE